MKYYPVYFNLNEKRVLFAGAGMVAIPKLRLLMKTNARIEVYGETPAPQIEEWAHAGALTIILRSLRTDDIKDAAFVFIAEDGETKGAESYSRAKAGNAPVNFVDNEPLCDFITPAIIDRDPVTIAIGTEGTAPVLARKIKADIEARLPAHLGHVAKHAAKFREFIEAKFSSKSRRAIWSAFYKDYQNIENLDEAQIRTKLDDIINGQARVAGEVIFVGAGPGDPELLTLKARKAIDSADVILHDSLVSKDILELARREAEIIETGKRGFAASWSQEDINALMVKKAAKGLRVIRLKSGDPSVYGRLDEEIDALSKADIAFSVIPGITAASGAAASLKTSLTRRGRNSTLRFLTAHDVDGFHEQDWKSLSKDGASAAIYMGKKAAAFLRGRLLIHGASPSTPVSLVANVSRTDEVKITTTLQDFPQYLEEISAPVVILYGIAPQASVATSQPVNIREAV